MGREALSNIMSSHIKYFPSHYFSTSPKAEQFPPKFHGLVLGLVELIDNKGINVNQPIWPSGCPTLAQKRA